MTRLEFLVYMAMGLTDRAAQHGLGGAEIPYWDRRFNPEAPENTIELFITKRFVNICSGASLYYIIKFLFIHLLKKYVLFNVTKIPDIK